MKIVTEFRGREVIGEKADRLRLEASIGVEVTRILACRPRIGRPIDAPERQSIRRAVDAVEARVVEAIWTLARLPNPPGPEGSKKHGLDYMQDKAERFANAVAAGGVWEQPHVRPALPSAREIDAMHEPLAWVTTRFLPRDTCKLITAAATTKRGDHLRRVSWPRVRDALPELAGTTVRTLQRRYEDGLRMIVAELSSRGRD